jgi:hypothetical protein
MRVKSPFSQSALFGFTGNPPFDASLIPNKCYPINSARAAITAVGPPAAYLIINISLLVRYASLSRRCPRNDDKFPWDAIFFTVPKRLDRT